jgi:hypothetical protein
MKKGKWLEAIRNVAKLVGWGNSKKKGNILKSTRGVKLAGDGV